MVQIALAKSEVEIARCFPVMQQLRPHLIETDFITRVRRQEQQGYCLTSLEDEDTVRAVAGFRLSESLSWGKFLYVDDLIVADEQRSRGYGQALLQWLINYAKSHDCQQLHLDSGVQRFAAHRFYFQQKLEIRAYHFTIDISTTYG